jgi:peptide/nickel transport system substrate-binding protein
LELFVDSSSHGLSEAYTRLVALTKGGQLWSMWNDPELDALFDTVVRTVDPQERATVYAEVQQHMRENPPFLYLYYPETFEGVTTRVVNYQPRAAENYYLWDVSVNDAE